MPAVHLSNRPSDRAVADAVALPVFGERGRLLAGPGLEHCSGSFHVDLLAALTRIPGFRGELGELATVVPPGADRPVLLACGLGPSGSAGTDQVRSAAMALGGYVGGYRRLASTLPQVGPDRGASIRACVEGLLVGSYRYPAGAAHEPHSQPAQAITLLLGPDDRARDAAARQAVEAGLAAGEAVCWVRRLVDCPADSLAPEALAEQIRERARSHGVSARIWSPRTMAARGFGATLAVGAGSQNPPLVVELVHGGAAGQVLGLAGKGITFDSGGINLKRDPAEIGWMKSDMAGAAAVAGAVCAAASLGSPRKVRAILPLAENMPGSGAMRPGDVVHHPDGRRTEVVDTDSEGRLVLADAIAYLAADRADAIVDVGTLTDGGGVGHLLWGCWGNSAELAARLLSAGSSAGEPGWELPLRPEYRTLLGSQVADLTNCSREVPDSGVMAATYLSVFAGAVPWVHIDNGSTAYLDCALDPWPRGATGSPVRALLQFLLAPL